MKSNLHSITQKNIYLAALEVYYRTQYTVRAASRVKAKALVEAIYSIFPNVL